MIAIRREWVRTNWFLAVAPVLLLVEWLVIRDIGIDMGRDVEAVVLFDLCVFMPSLFLICYRNGLTPGQTILRTMALVCLGIYLAGWLVPAEAQQLLPQLAWARTAGLVVLGLIELRVLLLVVNLVYRKGGSIEQVQVASGAPRWVARLLMLEARFWRAVWALIRRR